MILSPGGIKLAIDSIEPSLDSDDIDIGDPVVAEPEDAVSIGEGVFKVVVDVSISEKITLGG